MENSYYVYPYTHSYAKGVGETELEIYENSHKLNIDCKNAIENTIADNFDGMRLKADTVKKVIAEFGYDRVNYVLSNSVQRKSSDGRFSHKNKAWAKQIYIPVDKVCGIDRRNDFAVNSHPSVLDGFINQAKRAYQALNLWEPKHCNPTTGLNFEGKIMVLNPVNLKDEYKNPCEQLVLCEGGFGCFPTASGRKVFGKFLSDGQKCQYERSDFIGELKAEYFSEFCKSMGLTVEKLNEMGVNFERNQEISGMQMK